MNRFGIICLFVVVCTTACATTPTAPDPGTPQTPLNTIGDQLNNLEQDTADRNETRADLLD